MLFCRSNPPKSHPWLTASLVALAAVGVSGIFNSSRSMMRKVWQKMKKMISPSACPCKNPSGDAGCCD